MNAFRSSPRVQRRRRVLVEEASGSAQQPSSPRAARTKQGPHRRYAESALCSVQASMTDYLPRRRWTLAVWLLSGLTVIAGLLALYAQLPVWGRMVPREDLVAIDFADRGNLVAWFSSMSLLLAAVVMLAIYSVRQHRLDDYRGRFTVWLWAAGCAVYGSLDATAGVHHAIRGICVALFGRAVYGDGSVWWITIYGVVSGYLALRLVVEMQPSRIALTSLLVSMMSYATAVLILLELIPGIVGRLATIALVAGLLLGHLFLVFSLLTHARYVLLDALGRVAKPKLRDVVRRPKSPDNEQAENVPVIAKTTKSDGKPDAKRPAQTASGTNAQGSPKRPPVKSQPTREPEPNLRTVSAPEQESSETASVETEADMPESAVVSLSRAERKRLRKEKRRQRKAA